MRSTFMIERGSGVVMLLIVLLIAGTLSRPGISGQEPYFTYDFPTFARDLDSVFRATLFQFAVGAVAALVAAPLLYLTFRPYSKTGATLGAGALVVAGLLFVAGGVAGLQLHSLAEDWAATGHVRGSDTWLDARTAAGWVEALGFFSVAATAVSLGIFGFVIVRSAALPRALGFPAIAGGAVVVLAFVVWSIGPISDAGWYVFMAGMLGVATSFVLTAGWLTARGTRRPSPPTGPAAG